MSLINDALKRAKAAQVSAPPPETSLHLRPADLQPRVRHGIGYALPLGFAGLALLVLFFVWRYAQQGPTAENSTSVKSTPATYAKELSENSTPDRTRVRARERDAFTAPTTKDEPPSAAVARQTQPASVSVSQPASETAILTATPQEIPVSVVSNALQVAAAPPTNTVATAAPPTPPAPRLQGIVYDPKRPSAVINGKTLFVGEKFAGARVTAITPTSVTLFSGSKTNVLTLEE